MHENIKTRWLILSDSDTSGGAAIAATRLAEGLKEIGQEVIRVVSKQDTQSSDWEVYTINFAHALDLRILGKVLPDTAQIIRRQRVASQLGELVQQIKPDVINVHNVHGGLFSGWSLEMLRVCHDFAPLVLTLHDMWSFTGCCAYDYDCQKFIVGCDAQCPVPEEYPSLRPDKIAASWQARQQLYSSIDNLNVVAPSHWMAQEAQKGMLGKYKVSVIPYGISTDDYKPIDRKTARRALGLEENGVYFLVAAQSLSDPRKGGPLIHDALTQLSLNKVTLLTMGGSENGVTIPGMNVRPLGYLNDDAKKVLVYNSADMLIHAALADNLPNVVLEALACGTPVAALPVGGIVDMVRNQQTGWLAREATVKGLVEVIQEAYDTILVGSSLRQSCRDIAVAEYSLHKQAEQYEQLVQS